MSTLIPNASLGVPDVINVTEMLWERAADNLAEDELKWFIGATGEAERAIRNLTAVVEGIGCLVTGDDSNTGNFQSKADVSSLLFCIGESLRHVGALAHIGDSAAYRLAHPDLYRELAEARARDRAAEAKGAQSQ
jgi:hypothetical protein